MDIGRTEGVHGPGRIEGPKLNKVPPAQPGSAPSAGDKVEISDGARFISELTSMPPIRQDRIDEIRKLIESGQYETDERLEGAIERLLRENPDLFA